MKRLPSRLALSLLASFFVAWSAHAADPVATVNGTAIPASRAAVMMDEQKAQGAPESAELKDAIREELIRREVLAQAASKAGFDKRSEIQAQMDLARQAVLIRAYLQDYVKNNPVSDAELQKEYDVIKARMTGKEYKARHILVETEDEAKAVIDSLKAGTDFAELSAKHSKDPGSKDRGGELGWSSPDMFVKPFSDAMVALEKGQRTAAPVKSDFGYHVIQLDDVRDVQPPPMEEVKPQLQQRIQQSKVETHLNELREKAKVK